MSTMPDVRVSLFSRFRLPLASNLKGENDEFWNLLEIRTDRISNNLRNPQYISTQLTHLSSEFIRGFTEWCSIGENYLNIPELGEIISTHADDSCIQTLFHLIEFCENRKIDSFRTATKELLSDDQFAAIDSHFNHMPTNRLLLALCVFCNNSNNLKFLLLWDNVDNRSYQRYSLVPPTLSKTDDDSTESEVSTSEIEQRIKDGVDLANVSVESVNQVLIDFEDSRSTNRRSICQGILLADTGTTCWVFIKRQYKENYITEVNRTIFADEAELVIMQFRDKIRELDIKFELTETVELAAQITSHLIECPVEYIPVNESTLNTHIQKFLDDLVSNDDTTMKLIEVDNSRIALAGSPGIILRGNKNSGIVEALKLLEANHRLSLLDNLENLNSIKLSYTSPIPRAKRAKQPYIVTIYVQKLVAAERYFVSYSTRAPIRDRSVFEKHLWDKYEIKVVPKSVN